MSTYLLWDDKNDILLKFTNKSSEIAACCLGRNINHIKIFKNSKLIQQPYETDVTKLQRQIEIWPDIIHYLENELFEI